MRAFATRLIDFTELNADKIAAQWVRDVKTNIKTYSYHDAPAEKIMRQAIEFYHSFRQMFFDDSPYEQAEEIFEKFADDNYQNGIPLHETMYAMILMRRHIWLYAEFQSIVISETEHRKAIESLSRTILMFDYIMYVIARKYWKIMKLELQEQSGRSTQ
ncbi:MAG: hypothetical protein JW943_13765 [Deltaproteobacteria bacterium]|nr:hypothetical protein [Deltaproteobacteria bacterium]